MSDTSLLVAYAVEPEGARVAARYRSVQTGVGKAQMACGLAAAILDDRPAGVLLIGVCGAYPKEHLGAKGPLLLDICLVDVDRFADEGVETAEKFVSIESLGFPPGGPYPADLELTKWAKGVLPEAKVVRGATVSTCSGNDVRSRLTAARTGAAVESMEGAAAALVCARLGVPFLQLRCVSNFTGDREKSLFDVEGAMERVQDAALRLLAAR